MGVGAGIRAVVECRVCVSRWNCRGADSTEDEDPLKRVWLLTWLAANCGGQRKKAGVHVVS